MQVFGGLLRLVRVVVERCTQELKHERAKAQLQRHRQAGREGRRGAPRRSRSRR
eukprot:COSAG04_NODE_70_length_29153_cov_152.225683_10_plen_54_part_00